MEHDFAPVLNLFSLPGKTGEGELFDTILKGDNVRIERIISRGEVSPDGFWYDQKEDEWVALLSGEAILNIDGRALRLKAGDHIMIPSGVRHRVDYTSFDRPCIWLCVFGRFDDSAK